MAWMPRPTTPDDADDVATLMARPGGLLGFQTRALEGAPTRPGCWPRTARPSTGTTS